MWRTGTMYGGFSDRNYGYNLFPGGNAACLPQSYISCRQPNGLMYPSPSCIPRQLDPIQPQQSPQLQPQQVAQQNADSPVCRFYLPTINSAAYWGPHFGDVGGSSGRSSVDTSLAAVTPMSSTHMQNYDSLSQKQFTTGQPLPLPQYFSMRNGNGPSSYSLPMQNLSGSLMLQQLHPQLNGRASQLIMPNCANFRRSNSSYGAAGFNAGTLQRINSGFDSRPSASFRGVDGLQRQFSTVGGDMGFYGYTTQPDTSNGGDTEGYGESVEQPGALQRDKAGGNSLHRMYSYAVVENTNTLNRGPSNYGSFYGGHNLYGDAGGVSSKGSASFYRDMSSGNLQHTYSFAGAVIHGYESGFNLLDAAAEQNEFGGEPSEANLWNTTGNTEYDALNNTNLPRLPSFTPPLYMQSSIPRPRSHSAPASRPTPQLDNFSPPMSERAGHVQRRRRQRPQRRANNEAVEEPQMHNNAVGTVVEMKPLPNPNEEELLPIKRLGSAPVNTTRNLVTPFDQMRALRRVQTSGYQPPNSQTVLSSSRIGRRRDNGGGLTFSGVAVV
ncbi:hypothetical protein ABB37_02378 [Leptomonas pyrrhocoris]|uniref:Uncharacterized protein n=1 Tax=Leptomonas pyrrhocoris TaxID=157538 RepID=A0A0N0DYQ6_LEPPY|nr:hypothetical protein ABB37_02378 [Leptomonas pyrrhocoris]KPA84395.1 hypothetical protein ABB37_02378 [Leptomonas pyrrhocoris]|eukprot:XP_015662834.1 hypothetical protein ABB37_02378 [Leptomonas pyrrhocoris]